MTTLPDPIFLHAIPPPFPAMTPIRSIPFLIATLWAGTFAGFAAANYEPKLEFSLTEKWRWHELEALSEFIINRGVEDPEGNLVFTGEKSLLVYDGYSISKHAYPNQEPDFEAYHLFASQNGLIYLNSTYGIYAWDGETWEHVLADGISTQLIRPTFTSNGRGLELLAVPTGVYQIDGRQLIPIPQLATHFTRIAIDGRNRFWGVKAADQQAIYLQFDEEGPAAGAETTASTITLRQNAFPDLIAHPDSNEVWSVNWLVNVPAARFDDESGKWLPQDLNHLSGNNRHAYGFHLNGDDMLIFSKTAILVRHLDEWHTIEYPEFDFPTNHPFIIQRANGKLIIGGRGEKIFEVDYNSNRRDAYQGLHFQCDVGGRSRWFLSVEGQILEQDTTYDNWTVHDENVIDTPIFVLRSQDDTIWAAGSHDGTAAVSYFNGRSWTRRIHPELNSLISHHSCRELPNGDIVFGSGEDDPVNPNGGLVIYRKSAVGYSSTYHAPPSVPSRPVGIAVTADDQFWFGGRQLTRSLLQADQTFSTIDRFQQDRWVDDVSEDDRGNLWTAIWERGLFRYDGSTWHAITEGEDVTSNQICYILKDQIRTNSMWFATDRGVSRFDGERWYPQAMPPELGFGREGGNLRQSSDGAIWMNVATRDWFFRKTTKFYLTKRMHDQFKTVRYVPDEQAPVVTLLPTVTQTTAPANVLVNWRGVDKWSVTPRNRLKYSFRLNDEPWSPFAEGENHVFLDVPTGEYTFGVRALDRDGNISQIATSTVFRVIPPVWQRPWFIALMIVLVIIIVFLTGMLFRQRIRHVIQMDEFKLQFFTNISHELRTPLTVILGPLESQLAKLPDSWDRKPLEIAYKNTQRTLKLIDQLLDFRSAETDNIKINLAQSDLVVTIKEVLELLQPLATERSQKIEFVSSTPKCVVMFDTEVIEKTLNNLVGNAIKYTQVGGLIIVRFDTSQEAGKIRAHLVVEDNGMGIPSDNLESIFQVFVRARSKSQRGIRGSGIGLAYVKKLVEICQGTIAAESPITVVGGNHQGTRFSVMLPLESPAEPTATATPVASADESIEEEMEDGSFDSEDPRPHVLIVEDDDEIRGFLTGELSQTYRISTAPDGAQALTISAEQIPDLIITDVMMPQVDGKELCRQIKAAEATSHIPVIMLTALKSEQHELEGLQIGADDYLSKPVRIPILKHRIHNLLDSRLKLQKLFQTRKGEATFAAQEITTNPIDEAFMNNAVTTVEENLIDPLFDVESFALKMFMSRMTLYRKLKAITGDSPSAFIRSIRMNKAAALLATKEHNVSETADLVGLPDLSSFSTAFKKHFNVSPSQYTRRNDTTD